MRVWVVLRRITPRWLRLRRALLLRAFRDRRAGIQFAGERTSADRFLSEWSTYARRFVDYPGQEHLGRAKRLNQRLLAQQLDGVVVHPGEVFSLWKLAKQPSAGEGYANAAALRDRQLTTDVGGAICLLSTVLYNAGLLAGLEVIERHCHSVDSYGARRYFELGRDAAIEFGYLDLRFRNPHACPLRLSVEVSETEVRAGFAGSFERSFDVRFSVSQPEALARGADGRLRFQVHTARLIAGGAGVWVDDLGWSVHVVPPELEGQPLGCASPRLSAEL